jgi:hypothetical protein
MPFREIPKRIPTRKEKQAFYDFQTISATITPLNVWNAYPGSDLLAIDPPEEYENFKEYIRRVKDDLPDVAIRCLLLSCKNVLMAAAARLRSSHLMHRAMCDLGAIRSMADERTFGSAAWSKPETPIRHLALLCPLCKSGR